MTAPGLLKALKGGAKKFKMQGHPGTWTLNGSLTQVGRAWAVRVNQGKVYSWLGSANAKLWEVLKEATDASGRS